VSDLADQREDVAHGRALSDQVSEGAGLIHGAPQAAVLLLQDAEFQRPLDGEKRRLRLERLGDVVEGARAHGLDRGVDAAEGGHQHHGSLRPDPSQLAHHVDAGLSRHPDVAQHRVELDLTHLLERVVG
jgi:hypothetical protein